MIDGFYLGNDLHDITLVWDIKKKLDEWISRNPSRARFWGPTMGTKEENAMQSRLRLRRRVTWKAIQMSSPNEEAVVIELQVLQNTHRLGISRVEAWAQEAIKHELSILEVAKSYCSKLGGAAGMISVMLASRGAQERARAAQERARDGA